MRLPSVLFSAALITVAIVAAPREVYYQGPLTPLNTTPTFDKGYLFVYDAHKIDVFGPDGALLYAISAQVSNCKVVNINNAAIDTDGTIAGAVEYAIDGTTRMEGGGITVFDRSGKQVRFFDTGPYTPTQVSFGPDHTIWTLGWPGFQVRRWDDDFLILRNYSQDGQQLGAFLPRSSFDAEPDPVGPMVGMWELRVIGDRVGAVLYLSSIYKEMQSPRASMEWVETDLKGNVLGRWDIPSDQAPEAFTQSGGLYTHEGKSVFVFDRVTKAWRRVATPADGGLLGADGDNLVFLIRGTNTLRWVPTSQ
jgi:hypothetical protein